MNLVKVLFFSGVFLVFLAGVVLLIQKIGFPLGRLPGDIYIKKENSSFYFPIATCLLISVIISLLHYLFRK